MEDHLSISKIVLPAIFFFVFAPFTLAMSFVLFDARKPTQPVVTENPAQIFASLPGEYPTQKIILAPTDSRVALLEKYLKETKSPLVPYAKKIVDEADKVGLDFRLLVAIGRQESNLCRYAPEDTYNCWGWGIHKRGTLGFTDFNEAIEVVTLGIKQNYIDKGLVTPEQIMSKYTPSSNGSWAEGVTQFMEEIS